MEIFSGKMETLDENLQIFTVVDSVIRITIINTIKISKKIVLVLVLRSKLNFTCRM